MCLKVGVAKWYLRSVIEFQIGSGGRCKGEVKDGIWRGGLSVQLLGDASDRSDGKRITDVHFLGTENAIWSNFEVQWHQRIHYISMQSM